MEFEMLNSSRQHSVGAMFRKSLDNIALVFAYPRAASRLFHTAFCRPLRIVALSDAGEIIFDQIVRPWRMVRIPATRLVVELDPAAEVDEAELGDLALADLRVDPWTVGSWHPDAGLDRLFFALIAEAVADIRRVYEAINRAKRLPAELLPNRFKPWERGQILGSAALVLDSADQISIPENAVRMAHQIIEVEKKAGQIEELLAASIAGAPWTFPRVCFKCETIANWRPVLSWPADMPAETAWRYERPENCVPICRRCVYFLNWKTPAVRRELAYMLWGARFEAFEAWHRDWQAFHATGSWDLERYPLWPAPCGGATWAQGSGALEHADPEQPRRVHRGAEHLLLLDKYFQRKAPTRRFWPSPQPHPARYEPAHTAQGAGA